MARILIRQCKNHRFWFDLQRIARTKKYKVVNIFYELNKFTDLIQAYDPYAKKSEVKPIESILVILIKLPL